MLDHIDRVVVRRAKIANCFAYASKCLLVLNSSQQFLGKKRSFSCGNFPRCLKLNGLKRLMSRPVRNSERVKGAVNSGKRMKLHATLELFFDNALGNSLVEVSRRIDVSR